ncbi:uroporphyrinogen-III decarboxylase [Ereboglobus sp. PH5-5]|uniref:uroporphyrinogen decarboxylase family protein n=1 Tax=Ereboglobus sp. PH5-5 TaxID=2940529 RepID=UPI00240679F4|nr:uroporphyrinogen decarboxylase family protein [Ereboglobus sp. PH5-5]MDF9833344.1 uroporphyrinogen-III decarboxylase [Ereboglobus sp. PH5-5]
MNQTSPTKPAMNHVERFRAVMRFQPVDRMPRWEWAMWWDKTIARWHGEGLPAALNDVFDISCHFGLDPYKQFWFSTTESTIEAVQHHVEGVVAGMDDYLALRPKIYPRHEEAIAGMTPWALRQKDGKLVVWITLEGFFWFTRTLMGFEQFMYAYIDQPELVHKISEDLLAYNLDLLERISRVCVPVFLTIAEDMSYNNGPMISRAIFDEFMAPYYRRLMERVKELDAFAIVDTDGDVTKLVPWLQSVGVDGVLPLEYQAGVDGLALREAYPDLLMIGHYNKLVMNQGEAAMRREFERLLPLMRRGGFIPSVDHQTPPGVSLQEYHLYLRLLQEYTQPDVANG